MKLSIIGSSSSGNGYVLQADYGDSLVIEAGMKPLDVMKSVGFNQQGIKGVLVSHGHSDHSRYLREYANLGIRCYASQATLRAYGIDGIDVLKRYNEIAAGEKLSLGNFTVMPFELVHDVPCLGFLIKHEEIGKLVFATDTASIPQRFVGLTNLMVECNFREAQLMHNYNSEVIGKRQMLRTLENHLSLEQLLAFLGRQKLNDVSKIILLHLSDNNSNERDMIQAVSSAANCEVVAAKKGMNIELSKEPF